MRLLPLIILSIWIEMIFIPLTASAAFELSLKDAEIRALETSDQLKALGANEGAASEQADAQHAALWPKLSLNANYQYLTNVPSIPIPIPGINASIPFGANNNYSVGPVLSYTLWDTGGARDAYHGLDLLAHSRGEEKRNGQVQLLLSVRSSYLRLQLALEELRVLGDSLGLARAQNRDIESNFRAGAATRLDRVDSQREVLSSQLQFDQKQAEVGSDFKDLLALIHETPEQPPSEIHLDSLDETMKEGDGWIFSEPDENHPQMKSQELLALSSEKSAESQMDYLYPTLQASVGASLQYPMGPVLETVEQNTFAVSLSMPLFEASRTRHQAAEKKMEAETARFNREQTRTELKRDYAKATEMLESLKAQRTLSSEDVERSREAARLYYQSYKGGKLNFVDVLGANNRALTSQVNAARIDAQLLNQLFILKSLSGENTHGR